jgi:hypothetical protein
MTDNELITALTDLKINIGAYRAEMSAQNLVTNTRLLNIDNHLATLNGRTGALEKSSNERMLAVAAFNHHLEDAKEERLPEKVRALEDSQLSTASIKKWVAASIAITGTVVSIIFTIINYFAK